MLSSKNRVNPRRASRRLRAAQASGQLQRGPSERRLGPGGGPLPAIRGRIAQRRGRAPAAARPYHSRQAYIRPRPLRIPWCYGTCGRSPRRRGRISWRPSSAGRPRNRFGPWRGRWSLPGTWPSLATKTTRGRSRSALAPVDAAEGEDAKVAGQGARHVRAVLPYPCASLLRGPASQVMAAVPHAS